MDETLPNTIILFHGRMPSERAAALWAAKTAEALADVGATVTLVATGRGSGDPFGAYHIKHNFKVVRIPVINLFNLPGLKWFAFHTSSVCFAFGSLLYLLRHARRMDAIFSNEPLTMLTLSFFYPRCFYELHVFPTRRLFLFRTLFRRMCGIISINHYMAQELAQKFAVPAEKIIVAPSGVAIEEFDITTSRDEARVTLGLSDRGHVALYCGHLYEWKGAATLAEAAKLLPDVNVLFVGGTDTDVKKFRADYADVPNIRFVGHVPHLQVALWQKAADVLVLPNTAKKRISKYYTSPMKLFEYMAAGRPIVASRLPSITEIVSDQTAFLVEPDDPQALARGIESAFDNHAHAAKVAQEARKEVERYSWRERGSTIANFIQSVV